MVLKGINASDGVGLGRAVCVREESLDYSQVPYSGKEAEKARLQAAIEEFNARTSAMADHIREQTGPKEAEILTGQITMLADPFMQSQMQEAIDGGSCAEGAADAICTMYADMFAGVEDEMMRQRATDVRDIRTRLLSILLGVSGIDLSHLPAGTILVAKDLTPSMTVGLNKENVVGILTETGGRTSHSAILARALQLPAVLSIPKALELIKDGDGLIVDGGEGVAVLNPDALTRSEYLAKQKRYQEKTAALEIYRGKPTADADGKYYHLYANIGSAAEAEAAAQSGAEGIGLFRTEFLFMDRTSAPDETIQYEAYRAVSKTMEGKEVIIRTLDVGGDKAIDYLGLEKEENPFLGHRAIRYCLDRPELYKVQLKALLRAGAEEKNIKIMLPLVTCVEEGEHDFDVLFLRQGHRPGGYDRDPRRRPHRRPAGPGVRLLFHRHQRLTQYTMAVDRGNAKVAKLYSPFQPAVLRSIRSVISAGKRAGIPVGMCGEAAADPGLIPLLMCWGLDEFSVSSASVLATRAQIHRWHEKDFRRITEEALGLSTASGVEGYLKASVNQS